MKAGIDYCKCCKSKKLWNNHIDEDGLYNENGRYVTICQDCGTIQEDYKKQKEKKTTRKDKYYGTNTFLGGDMLDKIKELGYKGSHSQFRIVCKDFCPAHFLAASPVSSSANSPSRSRHR
jgi:uncharacterized Zn ribbon protein